MGKAPEKEAILGKAEAEVQEGAEPHDIPEPPDQADLKWSTHSLVFCYTKSKGDDSDLEAPTTHRPRAESLLWQHPDQGSSPHGLWSCSKLASGCRHLRTR